MGESNSMLKDYVLHTVIERVLNDWFPGTELAFYGPGEEPDPDEGKLVPYVGDLEEPRSIGGLFVPSTGVLGTERAQAFLDWLPGFIISDYKWGHNVGLYGSTNRALGISGAHLDFDERLIGAVVRTEAARVGDELDRAIYKYLAFLRTAALHRYEGRSPEIALVLGEDVKSSKRWLGRLSEELLQEEKSLLVVCEGGGAALEVAPDGRILSLVQLPEYSDSRGADFSPLRASSLARVSRELSVIALHLDQTPSISIFVEGFCRFRFQNGRYLWVEPDVAASELHDTLVAKQIVRLGAILASRHRGAIIVPIVRNRGFEDKLATLLDTECVPGLYDSWDNDLWIDTLGARGQFRAWLLQSGANVEKSPVALLTNLLGTDGASFIDAQTGDVLGYGAIVSTQGSFPGQGARTTAASLLSERFGSAIKVSEDGHAVLFKHGRIACQIW